MSSSFIYQRLRADLHESMRRGDTVSVSVLRTAISAIDNAGAVEASRSSVAMVGFSEDVDRRELNEAAVREILSHEIQERRDAAVVLKGSAQGQVAEQLLEEIEILSSYVDR